jgi:outer membrane protein TolC
MQVLRYCFAAGVVLIPALAGIPCLAQASDPSNPLAPNPDLLNRPTEPDAVRIQSTQPLTLQQAIDLAEQNNRLLQIARLEVEVFRTLKREAQSALLPRLIVGSDFSYESLATVDYIERQLDATSVEDLTEAVIDRDIDSPIDLDGTLLGDLADRSLADIADDTSLRNLTNPGSLPLVGTITLSYAPDVWGGRSAAVQAADRQVRASELEVQRQTEDLRLLVTTEYYNLQEADELVRISQVALENALAVLRDAEGLRDGGVGTRLDVQRSQVLVANIRQDLELALTLQKNARRQLTQRLGISETVDISAADPVAVAGSWSLLLEESIVAAYRNRSELDELILRRDISQSEERIAQTINRPQLSLFARYTVLNVLDSDPNPGFVDGYAVGATMLWELYDGGAANARADRQEINQQIAEVRFAETRDLIRFQVEESYNNLQANAANIETATVSVSEAKEVLRRSRIGFQAGVTTQLEVTTAQTDLTRAETNLIRSILNYNRALAALQRAVNSPGDGE